MPLLVYPFLFLIFGFLGFFHSLETRLRSNSWWYDMEIARRMLTLHVVCLKRSPTFYGAQKEKYIDCGGGQRRVTCQVIDSLPMWTTHGGLSHERKRSWVSGKSLHGGLLTTYHRRLILTASPRSETLPKGNLLSFSSRIFLFCSSWCVFQWGNPNSVRILYS